MALSQDEQRMLAEIERRLAADDPGLASCLTTFRRPSPATVLRSPRARIIGSLFTVLLVAMVSLMIYAMIPFRTHVPRHPPQATTSAPSHPAISVATGTQPAHTQQASASVSTGAASVSSGTASAAGQPAANHSAAGQPAANHSAASTATGKSQQAGLKAMNVAVPSGTNP
jgi:predicted lipid-binding transport protein (Tim44 family)